MTPEEPHATRFRFMRLHIPTGRLTEEPIRNPGQTLPVITEEHALRLINKWNSQQPGLWQYWLL